MNKKLLLSFSLMSLAWAAQAQYRSQVWCPDNGNGTYANPVINADYSDPDFGVMMVKTKNGDPAGKWEQPVCVIRGQGYIDTTPLWDDDGRCYLVNGWANSPPAN